MTFLNLFMLFGAAAASIPLIIHLLNRSKYEIIDWGAMHLLQAVIEENNRRIKIYEFLLLLIRCLIPIILAFCLARPLVNQFALGGSSSTTQTLVVLDDSLSMATTDGGEETRLQRATGIIEELREQLGNADSLRVVPDLSATDLSVTEQAAYSGNFDLRRSILEALDLASKERSTPFEIVVVSDFQQAAMSSLDESAKREIATKLESIPLRPAISLLPVNVDGGDAKKQNLRITNLVVDSQRVVIGETIEVTAQLTNESSEPLDDLVVELLLDGQPVLQEQMQLSPNAAGPISFEFEIDSELFTSRTVAPGEAFDSLVSVRCQWSDDCKVDNQADQVVSIISPIRAAVVTKLGRSSVEQNEDNRNENGADAASDFLVVALSPYAFAGDGEAQSDRISAVRINGKRLRLEDLTNVDVMILVDPAELTQEIVDQVTGFVKQGGGLLIFSGPRSEGAIQTLNQMIAGDAAGWLQGTISPMDISDNDRGDQQDPAETKLQSSRFAHPTMQLFNEGDGAGIRDVAFKKWLKFEGLGEGSSIIASLSSGASFAVETRLGSGTIIYCASSADTSWNNLPLRPAYLPLVQRWVEYLAFRGQGAKNQPAGTPALVEVDDAASLDGLQVLTPAGRVVSIGDAEVVMDEPTGDADVGKRMIAFGDTREVGVYQLLRKDSSDAEVEKANNTQMFVTTAMPEEFSSPRVTGEQLRVVAEQYGINLSSGVDQYFAGRLERAMGFEVWYWIWWGVLGLMVAERLVVWMLGRIA